MATNIDRTVQAEALCVSELQPSDQPNSQEIDAAIETALRTHGGPEGCASDLAAEYGEHPETMAQRMRWALQVIQSSAEIRPNAA